MKKFVIWLFLLNYLCFCEHLDYRDYYPENIPLQAENPSPEYKTVMKNLCDNWHSPISYLKKRGYMPKTIPNEPEPNGNLHKKIYHKNPEQSGNYFFFPENKEQKTRNSITLLENDQTDEKPNMQGTEPPPKIQDVESKNDTTGIIDKVKDKFLSIFSHKNKGKTDNIKETFDLEDPEFLEEYDDEYEISDKRLFARSITEKPLKPLNSSNEGILSNLTDSEIHFIKSFINWFKQNKSQFKFLSQLNGNITASVKSPDIDKSNGTNPNGIDSNAQNSTESGAAKTVPPILKPVNNRTECTVVGNDQTTTTVKPNQGQAIGIASKNSSSTSSGSEKDALNDFTIDLDINQKNGTGEETLSKTTCACVQITSKSPTEFYPPTSSDRNKYITKSQFLAHLHHMVDEVGRPPHKPLDLAKVQEIIDNTKKLPTVIMSGGDKTTQCAPLRLNDMSFDLEWNKINRAVPSVSYPNQPQSLAAKFLQEANPYLEKNNEYLKAPYADNFLDFQQSLPSDLELPIKSSTKREVGLPSFGKQVDTYYFPDNDDDPDEESPKRRIKGRVRGRNKKKPKPKQKNKNIPSPQTITLNSNDDDDDTRDKTDFNSFDELKDIQFRVNNDDEEAISAFISSLNSPPEVFSFDVDKYLNSAKQNMEVKAPEFEYKSPEARTYYEFLEPPAIENERLPLIEQQSDDQVEPVVDKRSRESRDLLRQYIKGVSSALNRNFDDINIESYKKDTERSSNSDADIQLRTNNLIDDFSTHLDAMDSIKSKDSNFDDSLNNYYPLNDGSVDAAAGEEPRQSVESIPNDYSPQSLEIDLDLEKKFRDLNIDGRYTRKNELRQGV